MLEDSLEKRSAELSQLIAKAQVQYESAPSGRLVVSRSHGVAQYYCVPDAGNCPKEYIPAENRDVAMRLAQKEYCEKVLRLAQKEKKLVDKLLDDPECGLRKKTLKSIYENLPEAKKELVVPYEQSDSDYVKQWEAAAYEKKPTPVDSPYVTEKGERVRSKSELIIANSLSARGINYRYEQALKLQSGVCVHPDFRVLNARTRKEWLWEHFGMMDNAAYCKKALWKIERYMLEGIYPGSDLIITYETSERPFGTRLLDLVIQRYLL